MQIEVTLWFLIKGEIADVNIGVDDGRVWSAGGLEIKVGTSFHGDAVGVNLRDPSEIEIIAGYVEVQGAGSWVVGGTAGNDGIVLKEMNIIQREFTVGEMKG